MGDNSDAVSIDNVYIRVSVKTNINQSNSDMELANDFNEHFTNIGTAFTPSSTSSRVYDHDRHGGNKLTFTEIPIDQVVDELKAISQNKGSGLDGISTKLNKLLLYCVRFLICASSKVVFQMN